MTEIALRPGEYITNTFHRMTERKLEEHAFSPCRVVWTITTGRSGTQWLANLLSQFEAISAHHEPVPSLFSDNRAVAEGERVGKRALWNARRDLVVNAYGRGMCYVDVSPFMSHLVAGLREAFAGSRFLHLVRDPRKFVCSAAPRDWYRYPHAQDHWWPNNHPEGLSNVQRLIWWWGEVHRRGLEAERAMPDGTFRLRAEDMWSDWRVVVDLLEWLKLPPTLTNRAEQIVIAHQNRPRNTSEDKNVTRSAWDPEWDDFLYDTCGDVMQELGYE